MADLRAHKLGERAADLLETEPGSEAQEPPRTSEAGPVLEELAGVAHRLDAPALFPHPGLMDHLVAQPGGEALYLLCYCSPAQALDVLQEEPEITPEQVDAVMAYWKRDMQALLSFFQANRERSLLVNFNETRWEPAAFIARVSEFIGAELLAEAQAGYPRSYRTQLFEQLSQHLTSQIVDAQALYADAKLQCTLLGDLETLNNRESATADQLTMELWQRFNAEIEQGEKINVLQMKQLQEEIEHYFGEVLRQEREIESLIEQRASDPHDARADSCSLHDLREFDDELHVDLRLKGLQLNDGRTFETLGLKLIVGEQRRVIELRPEAATERAFRWNKLPSDEHGPLLTVVLSDGFASNTPSTRVFQSLSSRERKLVAGIAAGISRCSGRGRLGELLPADAAHHHERLQECLATLEAWWLQQRWHLSFDNCSLIEERRTEEYEHLWLQVDKPLIASDAIDSLDFKLALHCPVDTEPFAESYALEFREPKAGRSLFHNWPPDTLDEHGHYLQFEFKWLGSGLVLLDTADHALQDLTLLDSIMAQLPHMLGCISRIEARTSRDWDEWQQIAGWISQLSPLAVIAEQPAAEEPPAGEPRGIEFREMFHLPGYAHLAFEIPRDNGSLTAKLQANKLDMAHRKAVPSLELRSADLGLLPFADTKLVKRDEHGAFVKLHSKSLRSRFTRKPINGSHKPDIELLEELLRQLAEAMETLELEESAETPDKAFWKDLSTALADELVAR
jgi:hypothetical protein